MHAKYLMNAPQTPQTGCMWLQKNLVPCIGGSQAPETQNTWCMRQLMYVIENCIGESPITKKMCK